jgi:SnoaL-like domain
MASGDIDSVLSVYDTEAVFLNKSSETVRGRDGLKQELVKFAAERATFDFRIKQVIQSGDIALMHTGWTVTTLQQPVYDPKIGRLKRGTRKLAYTSADRDRRTILEWVRAGVHGEGTLSPMSPVRIPEVSKRIYR